jgi:hypothetical protein
MVFVNVMKSLLPKKFGVKQMMNVMVYRCFSSCALYRTVTVKSLMG